MLKVSFEEYSQNITMRLLTFRNRGHRCRQPPNHSATAVGGYTGGIIGY